MSSHHDLTPTEMRRHLRERMETEGALLAFETAVRICRDLKASATAKASAVNSLLRVGGYDGKPAADLDKPVSEMTYAETTAMIARLKREQEAAGGGADVFD